MVQLGGVPHYKKLAEERSKLLYDYIDSTQGFFVNPVDRPYRSRVNIPFFLPSASLDEQFLSKAA
jgi:phosphoserine aminotransferase